MLRFPDLREKDVAGKPRDAQRYRRERKHCVHEVEARIGKFTGEEMKSIYNIPSWQGENSRKGADVADARRY